MRPRKGGARGGLGTKWAFLFAWVFGLFLITFVRVPWCACESQRTAGEVRVSSPVPQGLQG